MNAKQTIGLVIAVVALMLVFATPLAAQPYDIRYNLKPNDVAWMRMKTLQHIITSQNGQEVAVDQNLYYEFKFECTAVDADGNMDVRYTISRIAMEMKGPNMTMKFDSANPSDSPEPLEKILGSMAGVSFTAKMNPKGKVLNIEGLTEKISDIIGKLAGGDPQMAAMFDSMFSEDSLKQMIEQSSATLPEEPVNIGDSWPQNISLAKGIPFACEVTYTLKDVTAEHYIIGQVMNFTTPESAEPMETPEMKMSIEFTGTMTGSMSLDRKTGLPARASMEQDIVTKTHLEFKDGSRPPMDVPAKITSTITLEMMTK